MRCLFVAAVCVFTACSNSTDKTPVDFSLKPMATGGTWVVKYSGHSLTDADLQKRFAEMNPYARARFQSVEQRRDYVEGMVRYELLAQEAIKRGYANEPEVVDAAKRAMVQLLMKKELDAAANASTPAQVKAYYDAHVSDFVKPAMTRLSHIYFTKEHRAQAEAMLKEVLALPPLDYAGFSKLAKANSEEPRTQPLEGDMRYLSDAELGAQYGAELVAAAAKLTQVGEVAPALVETEKGLHIVKLQGRQIALNLSVEAATPSIQSNLANDNRQQRFKAVIDTVKATANVEVNDAVLNAMVIDVKAPAVPATAPPAGYLPEPVVQPSR